jgi:hypothetical protein
LSPRDELHRCGQELTIPPCGFDVHTTHCSREQYPANGIQESGAGSRNLIAGFWSYRAVSIRIERGLDSLFASTKFAEEVAYHGGLWVATMPPINLSGV